MDFSERIYSSLPIWAQHASVSLYGFYWHRLRFGFGYQRYFYEYKQREKFALDEWQRWQEQRLHEILELSAQQVPYYLETWNAFEKKSANVGNLKDLPLLDKNAVRKHPQAFVRQDIRPINVQSFHTSGTTGTPIVAYYTVPELRRSQALREARSLSWAGVSFFMPRATFSGRIVEPDPQSKGPFYRYNIVEKQVYFSAFHLTPNTAKAYIEALHKHRIVWMIGYSFSFYLLAHFVLKQNIAMPPLKAVITTSEKLTPEMRQTMEKAYDCPIYEEYSTVENAIFASECEQGRLHISPDVSVVEILRPDGTHCEFGEIGEVVVTTLSKIYQPLIRFRLGDLAALDDKQCPCGRGMPVIREVAGRIEDAVVGPDGRQIVRFHGIFTDQPHILEGQIIQEKLNQVRVKIVPTNGFDSDDIADIENRVQQRLGASVRVIVETTDCIPRTKAGKFRAVISNLSMGDCAQGS